jgi:hypothetical protein
MSIKIKADEKLFNKWKMLGMKIGMLSSIVQNDMIIPEEQYHEFIEEYNELRKEMQDIMALTLKRINYKSSKYGNKNE